MVEADFDKKEATLKVKPVSDALSFIAAISNTRALAWALSTSSSPLTQDLHELYEIVIDGYQLGELEAASDMQPDWYAHALWLLYKDISKFFKVCYSEEDLRQGYRLRNPLTDYNREIKRFTGIYTSGVPPCLLVQTKQLATEDTLLGGERVPKRPAGSGGKIPKNVKGQDGKQWKDNKKFDATLKSVKQNIVQAHEKKIFWECSCTRTEQPQEKSLHCWESQLRYVEDFYCGDPVETRNVHTPTTTSR